ncbi:pullulanase-type alpha-1,6-glucosidase [Algibacillus agarilyticus]|uniref:pullulanase-type alpha-1,6-glucosidase n=1 Tax=Algibacillus agarilyticus TaxID=2234133 RepID=UPI001300756F|nr:pullulanase-type alpha-1,6-glucosidase [Algibacillus agarilyticus]
MRFAAILLMLLTPLTACENSTSNLFTAHFVTDDLSIKTDAHWLQRELVLLKPKAETKHIALFYDTEQALSLSSLKTANQGDKVIRLESIEDRPLFLNTLTHLNDFKAFKLDLRAEQAKAILKGSALLVQTNAQNQVIAVSRLQTGGVIDDLYTAGQSDADEVSDLGAVVLADSVSFAVWAPTAQHVEVLLFDKDKQALNSPSRLPMKEDPKSGVWRAVGGKNLNRAFYQYRVTVWHPETQKIETLITTDPYSLSLSTNSLYSQVVNLADIDTQPPGWVQHHVPDIDAPEDNLLYELHIRDFSASDKALSSVDYRGKYKAFSEQNSDGIKHLKMLKKAGLNNIHLLPTFDIGSVNEDPKQVIDLLDPVSKLCAIVPKQAVCHDPQVNKQQSVAKLLARYDVRGTDAQAVIEDIRQHDGYNWGYDPFHYTVPEGSYALDSDGISRLVEFREMVQSIHGMGFRVIMDVVYNHTFQAGLNSKSVLDKLVPNYYYRLNPDSGAIEQSTCCDNTATERAMMAKLMIDSLEVWAREYKIDGFRFDLMGHQPKSAMLAARERVLAVDPDNYFYGEGWNFGEVANDKQFEQAAQLQLAGSEIGTFTDRMRDAIRGGAPFDGGVWLRKWQGISNGLYTIPNDLSKAVDSKSEYYLSMDQARVGLAANLATFPLINAEGKRVTGADINYGGAPTGYALDPADSINYVSKHDNQSLWDNNQYRIAYHVSSEDRVRMQLLSISYPLMSQGIPFLHMGQELLRSKSFLRDSYDYGDWFNAVDFSKQTNNYDVGLPPAVKDKDNWPMISTLLKKNEGRDHVTPAQIQYSSDVFAEYISVRMSSILFRLRTAEDINQRVSFLNTGPEQQIGVIAMQLDDSDFALDLDANFEKIVVIFNNSAERKTVDVGNSGYRLHPIQQQGVDKRLIEKHQVNGQHVSVPALTTAVFVM